MEGDTGSSNAAEGMKMVSRADFIDEIRELLSITRGRVHLLKRGCEGFRKEQRVEVVYEREA